MFEFSNPFNVFAIINLDINLFQGLVIISTHIYIFTLYSDLHLIFLIKLVKYMLQILSNTCYIICISDINYTLMRMPRRQISAIVFFFFFLKTCFARKLKSRRKRYDIKSILLYPRGMIFLADSNEGL